MGLQARGCGGVDSASVGGTWDISNADRLGKDSCHLNVFVILSGNNSIKRNERADFVLRLV